MTAAPAPDIAWCDAPEPPGRPAQRRDLLLLAIEQRPGSATLHCRLGDWQLRSGAPADAAQAFAKAVGLAPDSADAAFGLGSALLELNQLDAALEQLCRADALRPDHPDTHAALGRALARTGRVEDALAELRLALDLAPARFDTLRTLTRLLINQDDHAAVLDACDKSLARVPGNASALAIKAQALLARGDHEAARVLLDADRFVRIAHPAVPSTADGSESFIAALERSVRANPGHQFEPEHRTARGGSRADLQPASNSAEAQLRDLLKGAIQEYRRGLVADLSHPFCAAAPSRASLVMWTNILSEGGYHIPHVHPAAWASGVFYVKVPGGGAASGGVLELACTEPLFDGYANPLMRSVVPEAGMLVLFPSYFYHRTVPTRTEEQRIAIAFDVVAQP